MEVKLLQLGYSTGYEWTLTANGAGKAIDGHSFDRKSFGMFGTWGGATVVLEGSWDYEHPEEDANYSTLVDDQSVAISKAANAAGIVLIDPVWIRPKMSNAGASSVTVMLVCK